MHQDQNTAYLLHRLYEIAPLKVRGHPPYVYFDPRDLDARLEQLSALEEPLRAIVPSKQRRVLYNRQRHHPARVLARLILRLNNIVPIVEHVHNDDVIGIRWNLGPLVAAQHAQYLWQLPEPASS
jgi:hypothetical protein